MPIPGSHELFVVPSSMSSDYLTNLDTPPRACTRCRSYVAVLCRLVAADRCLLRLAVALHPTLP